MKTQRLNELLLVVSGVRKDGRYICIYSDPEVRKAIYRCYEVGITVLEVKRIVEGL